MARTRSTFIFLVDLIRIWMIFFSRGDNAFCSLECRQQQMNQDERKEKFVMASKKKVVATPPSGSQVAVATATKGETTVVAL